MKQKSKVTLLSDADIYDVYGCQSLLVKSLLSDPNLEEVKARIYQIKDHYINSAKARIRAEARFCGLDVEDDSMAAILRKVRGLIESVHLYPLGVFR